MDGDATPLGQRPLSVLPVVHRFWASDWPEGLLDAYVAMIPKVGW